MRHRARPYMVALAAITGLGLVPGCSSASSGTAAWGATAQQPCDLLDTYCMLPFPDNYYTVADAAEPTGRRVVIPPNALPTGTAHAPLLDPTALERNDGFSPGSTILVYVPGIDLARSGVATLSDIGRSLAPHAPIVLLDANTGRRVPYWAELDATDPNPREQLLLIHPARSLDDGHRYLVALRNLRTASGSPIAPGAFFTDVLHDTPQANAHLAAHQAHLRAVLAELAARGVSQRGLFLAWDFTVISRQSLTGPALHMRDQAFAALGPANAPPFTVTSVVDLPTDPTHPEEAGNVARIVQGTFDVPDYLSEPGGPPGSVLHLGPNGLPEQLGTDVIHAPFTCEIPLAADARPSDPTAAVHPAHIGLYGHGLFGSSTEVLDSSVPQFSEAYDYAFCGTDWLGLSHEDVAYAAQVVQDLSKFQSIADRLTQSLLDVQFLGRLLDSPRGFATNPAFQSAGHVPLIDPSSGLVYYGNSLGGIMGGAVTALSTEVHRSVLGVPGMDFDLLLDRSADFTPFLALLSASYPDKLVQQFGFDLLQMLWDRGEADGYAAFMTSSPLPGTPPHQVLLAEAFGDHQVANVATETEARTIGAAVHQPALAPGRSNQAVPLWGLGPLPADASVPAGLYVWDSGVPAPPLDNVAPSSGPDPHDTVPRSLPAFWAQMNTFFTTGRIADPCGTAPCTAPTPTS